MRVYKAGKNSIITLELLPESRTNEAPRCQEGNIEGQYIE